MTVSTDVEGDLTRYTYTLANDARSDIAVAALSLSVDVTADVEDFQGPAGWTIRRTAGTSFLDLESPAAAFDLQPGTSGTFTFLSSLGPGPSDYLVLGLDETPPFRVETQTGQTSAPFSGGTPLATPEPGSLALLGVGALCLAGYGWGGRRRASGRRHQAAGHGVR